MPKVVTSESENIHRFLDSTYIHVRNWADNGKLLQVNWRLFNVKQCFISSPGTKMGKSSMNCSTSWCQSWQTFVSASSGFLSSVLDLCAQTQDALDPRLMARFFLWTHPLMKVMKTMMETLHAMKPVLASRWRVVPMWYALIQQYQQGHYGATVRPFMNLRKSCSGLLRQVAKQLEMLFTSKFKIFANWVWQLLKD